MPTRTSVQRAFVPLTLFAALIAAGCAGGGPGTVQEDRDALGTVVTITAYGEDSGAVRSRVDSAFAEIEAVESETNAYDESSTVAAFNADPFDDGSPPEAEGTIQARLAELGVTSAAFHTGMFGLVSLYDFEGERLVPSAAELSVALAEARSWADQEDRRRFTRSTSRSIESSQPLPGIDLGGAAKGLALDRAAAALAEGGAVDAALLTAGSTTLAFGDKPDGEPWRIGVEDPRDAGRVVAVVEASSAVSVSTSGDYQLYFERDGVRYHHILDPMTGRPARGLRSLTVIGVIDGIDSDILSTALFVMGPRRAAEYAREHGLALYMVDDEGRALIVPAPSDARFRLVEQETPKP